MAIGSGASAMRSISASMSSRGTTAPRVLICSTRAWAPSCGRSLDGVVDGADDDRVEQPADLEDVDRAGTLLGARRLPTGTQHGDGGRGAEQGDR